MDSHENQERRPLFSGSQTKYEIWIPLVYLLIASAYIYFSDAVVVLFARSSEQIRQWSTYKGWGFVLITAGLLWGVLARAFGRLRDDESRLQSLNRQLSASQQRLSTIIENARAIFWLKDLHGRILLVNRCFEELVRLPREKILGQTVFDLFPHPTASALAATEQQVLQTGRSGEFEERIDTPDGPRIFLSVKFPLRQPDGTIEAIGALCTDITALKQAQEDILHARGDIAHLSRVASVGEMASGLAHELNQPLTSIVCLASLCTEFAALAPDDPAIAKMAPHLNSIAHEAQRAALIIQRMRNFVRKHEAQKRPAEINAIVRESVDLLHFEFRRADVTPQFELTDHLPQVTVDVIQIQQVLVNLCQNALDAMEATPGSARRLLVRTSRVNGSGPVKVSVTDAGAAIDPALAGKMFESFFTTKPKGLGLGLGICRSILEDHGGQIRGHPNNDRGMTFEFVLPAQPQTTQS